jgi:hypothetical protein
MKASNAFLPGGGTQTDASAQVKWQIAPRLMIDAFVQHERYLIPIVNQAAQTNVTGQLQLTYNPHWRTSSE